MSEKYIKWELKNNPSIFRKISGEGFIDRQVLRHVISDVNKPESIAQEQFEVILNAIAEETDLIPPAADVAPVIRGHWIINSDGYYPQCSNCMREPESGKMTKFCPNCGAKMDESEDSTDATD